MLIITGIRDALQHITTIMSLPLPGPIKYNASQWSKKHLHNAVSLEKEALANMYTERGQAIPEGLQ